MTQIYTRPLISPLHSHQSYHDQLRIDKLYALKDHTATSTNSGKQLSFVGKESDNNTSRSKSPSSTQTRDSNTHQTRPGDMYQVSQKAPREQLPPLSSLFGSASSSSRPAQSPYSDRQSPIFPSASPQDGRQPATPIHPDRAYESSYFPRPTISRHYSHGSRPEGQERLGYPAPPRSSNRPESPRFTPRYVDSRQAPGPNSTNNWSPRSETSRQEQFPVIRAQSDQHRQPPPTSRTEHEPRPLYRDHSNSAASNYPPTPASTVVAEPLTVKDGLGPKIWTGTQFLPRFVKQADVPGEGLCYFYDDGTHCKTVIDGEVVNAHWGVTKAGKPRKRLAIACITCREKKIKCDPDYPRCVQCEKFGRVCKFKNAPRGGQGSPDTPPADPEDLPLRPGSSRGDEVFKVEDREASNSVSPRQNLRRVSPESESHHSKRQRNGYNDFTPVASEASPRLSANDTTSPSTAWLEPSVARSIDHTFLRDWQVDPFITKPILSTELLTTFFKQVPETVYCMFPENAFTSWALSTREKSLDDLMVIYSILALGATFSSKSDHKTLASPYAAIARYACDNRRFSIQLVQSRLVLSLYYFAINSPDDSWDFCGAALRAASGLKLNVEIEKTEDGYLQSFPYGLNRFGYAECRRRTFWSCYIIDRFNGFCSGHPNVIHPEDVFLRLPCDRVSFESQADIKNPFFDASTHLIHGDNWTVGSLAYLINIMTIWGDVMSSIYRSSQRLQPSNSSKFADYYQSTTGRLLAWRNSLPHCYAFSPENLAKEADSGRLGTFVTMHAVYHTTMMKLNRHVQHAQLNSSQINHHVSAAGQHANALLGLMDTLTASRSSNLLRSPKPTEKFSSPFVGYAIVSAIDILSAHANTASIPSLLKSFCGAQEVLTEIALFWQSARTQQAAVAQRVRDLTEIAIAKEQPAKGGIGNKFLEKIAREAGEGKFKMRDSLEKIFSREIDCIYA
ncbi:hypothetical protein ACMFMG_008225 [Clarireedia jacksonii]